MTTINLFWTRYERGERYEDWKNREIELSRLHHLALLSHERAGHNVRLYTYQKIKGIERFNVTVKSANWVLDSRDAHIALATGHSIAHIADAVRLKASARHHGVVMDMDGVVLRPFPNVDTFFATMPCKKTGGFAPKWGPNKPPMPVPDGSWDGKELTAFPIKVGPIIAKHANALADQIIEKLKQTPKGNWNFVMWALKDLAALDKDAKVYEPLYFCPVPAWLRKGNCYTLEYPTRFDGKTVLFGHTMPSMKLIRKKAYLVQHFFESTFKNAESVTDARFWWRIPAKSLLGREARMIVGPQWRGELSRF